MFPVNNNLPPSHYPPSTDPGAGPSSEHSNSQTRRSTTPDTGAHHTQALYSGDRNAGTRVRGEFFKVPRRQFPSHRFEDPEVDIDLGEGSEDAIAHALSDIQNLPQTTKTTKGEIITEELANDLFWDTTVISNDQASGIELLFVPKHIEEIGSGFNAPMLKNLEFFADDMSAWTEVTERGNIKKIGDDFSAPLLRTLDLGRQSEFSEIGRNFQAPSLQALHLNNTKIQSFPDDFRLPAIAVLNLHDAESFTGFPEHFFDQVPNLRSLHIQGTKARFRDLPGHIRNNPLIHVDVRPVGEGGLREDRQRTHSQTVHFSASQSAKEIVARVGDFDVKVEIEEIKKYIESLPLDPIPEGLEEILNLSLIEQKDYFESLPIDHPHRLYWGSEINAAKRAVAGRIPNQSYIDPASGISVEQFLAACWVAAKDPAARHEQVSLETAKEKFVRTLYEIQREYNLTGEANVVTDDLLPDVTSCPGGTFNKINNTQSETLVNCKTIVITNDIINARTKEFVKEKIGDMVRNGLAMSEFTAPDDVGDIFCTEEFANRMIGEFFKELADELRIPGEPDEHFETRAKIVQDYLYTQLTNGDMSEIIDAAKDSGKALAD